MTTYPSVALVALLAAACGSATTPAGSSSSGGGSGGSSSGGAGSSSGGGSSGQSQSAPFLGSYACTYAGTYSFTGSTVVHHNPGYTGTGVVTAGSGTDLAINGLDDGTLIGNGTITLDITSATTATFSPSEQSVQFTDTSGDTQTNTRTGTFTLDGTSGATLAVDGTFTGTTSAGVAYSGSYSGSWACSR